MLIYYKCGRLCVRAFFKRIYWNIDAVFCHIFAQEPYYVVVLTECVYIATLSFFFIYLCNLLLLEDLIWVFKNHTNVKCISGKVPLLIPAVMFLCPSPHPTFIIQPLFPSGILYVYICGACVWSKCNYQSDVQAIWTLDSLVCIPF